jgi:hypothetical protein
LVNASATTYALNGTYSLLGANGTLGPVVVTSVSLRNGEGAILVKVSAGNTGTRNANVITGGSGPPRNVNGASQRAAAVPLTFPAGGSPFSATALGPTVTATTGNFIGTTTASTIVLPDPKAPSAGSPPTSSGDGEPMRLSPGTKFKFGLVADQLFWKKIIENDPLFA